MIPHVTESKSIAVRGFDFVRYQVKDLAKTRAFYESLLDLKPGQVDSEHFVEYDLADGNTFALGHHPTAPFVAMGGIMFAVDDAGAAAEQAKALGGRVEAQFGGDTCMTQWCTDPDGNAFGLHQRK
jgi:predicted enzyme related to lactoylglutathione lyase